MLHPRFYTNILVDACVCARARVCAFHARALFTLLSNFIGSCVFSSIHPSLVCQNKYWDNAMYSCQCSHEYIAIPPVFRTGADAANTERVDTCKRATFHAYVRTFTFYSTLRLLLLPLPALPPLLASYLTAATYHCCAGGQVADRQRAGHCRHRHYCR